jgi:STE24 endopeptidase
MTITRSILLGLLLCISMQAQPSPAPAQRQTEVAAKPQISYSLPPDKLKKSEALYKLDIGFSLIGELYSWLILLLVLYSGIAVKYRVWAEAVSSRRFVQAAIFVPLLMITLALPDLPLRIYGHHISLQYGLSVQSWGSWLADVAKGEAVTMVILAIVLWIMTAIIRRSPRRWWFYFWLVSLPMMVFLVFIAPLVIDPLFNQFEPLAKKNPELVQAIERVVVRGGLAIPPERMYEMKASAKVTTLNAYVTGFGASKRVVVWDTSIQKLTTPEILFVFGHEMGHYVLHHILKGLIAGAIGAFIGLYILFYCLGWVLQRLGPRWRIIALHDWAAIPMIFLLAGIMSFFADPIGNFVSRYIEHQADVYGLEVTHNINVNPQQVAAHSFQVLGEMSLDYPYPGRLAVFWYWTHPPIADRVRFAQEYDPWAAGEEPRFVK